MSTQYKKVILTLFVLMSSAAYGQTTTATQTPWQEKHAHMEQKREALVADASDSSGMITQASLETAMESKARLRADKLFEKASPNGDPISAEQLTAAMKSMHECSHHKSKDSQPE